MKKNNNTDGVDNAANVILEDPLTVKMYSALIRNYFIRLVLTYILPLFLLIVYFHYQYNDILGKSRELHLMSIAESQARLLDIFLKERLNNIKNLIESPSANNPEALKNLKKMLNTLKNHSDAFIDLGFFDTTSIQTGYAGPITFLENKDYGKEKWFIELTKGNRNYIITDIYLGLRKEPHFTIGAKKDNNSKRNIFKVSLDPQKIYQYMTSLEKSKDVYIMIVNEEGNYQLAPKGMGNPMDCSLYKPNKAFGTSINEYKRYGVNKFYAYSWLSGVNWAVIVEEKEYSAKSYFNLKIEIILASIAIIILLFFIVFIRSKNIVKTEKEKNLVKLQLEQASKLATVGELAAGIAHEIGNPLNIIANEVGIMQDYANPKFQSNKTLQDMAPNFKKIMSAVYRIKDINKKLLTFVRKTDNEICECNINEIIEDLVGGFLEREMKVDNIEIIREFNKNIPVVISDNNQLRQVIINLLTNAHDAIQGSGKITITTGSDNDYIYFSVSDNGSGIPQEKINKIFLPFYTTKPVGKGTGLGLSVSYSIIKNLGGSIKVESIVGVGTTFTIILPINSK
ncbi:MAG: two-component system, NtrC family, sensor kinase [Bacteroidota bacterium]|nr:two-component system, NtrC family, sensor kinase [Bacteroidota bacterium]